MPAILSGYDGGGNASVLSLRRDEKDSYMPTSCVTSIVDLIGNTPTLELVRSLRQLGLGGRLFAKLEYMNPGGSKKDRVALEIVRRAHRMGLLAPGQPVVEVTSGNTGTGLAIVCRALGHPFYAVMSRGNTRERAQMMRALGAEVVLVDQITGAEPGRVTGGDIRAVRQRAAELVNETGAYFADQFENIANADIHEKTTGVELWEQCGGQLDAIVAFVGSGGALGGMYKYLRTRNPDLRAYVVEPSAASSLSKCSCSDAGHAIQGGGYGCDRLTLLRDVNVAGYITCTDEAAALWTQALARDEGVFCGYSTGAQFYAAVELLRDRERGRSIAFLACDTGMKYLSTPLYP